MQALRRTTDFLMFAIATLFLCGPAMAGGKGDPARVVIEGVILTNGQGGVRRAEVSGGGFLHGDFVAVSLEGTTPRAWSRCPSGCSSPTIRPA